MKDMIFWLIVMGCMLLYGVYVGISEDVQRKRALREAKKKRELIKQQQNTGGAGI